MSIPKYRLADVCARCIHYSNKPTFDTHIVQMYQGDPRTISCLLHGETISPYGTCLTFEEESKEK